MRKKSKLTPAFSKDNIAIYLASSDLYAPYAGIFVQSVIENSSNDYNYDILIIETDISEQNKEILSSIPKKYKNVSLRFVDVSHIIDNYTFTYSQHHSKYNFYRLTAPEVLSEYNKIIYVDCDLVVNCDISELYNIDLEDNYVAATRCIGMISSYIRREERKKYVDNVLQLKKPTDYFNSGVMLLNLELIRETFSTKQLLDMASEGEWMFCDQCVLNVLFKGKIYYLPLHWNVLSHSPDYRNEKLLPKKLYDEYIVARSNPKISHFSGNNIPVRTPDIDMYPFYWVYARKTPFYELLLSRMISESLKKEVPSLRKQIRENLYKFIEKKIAIQHVEENATKNKSNKTVKSKIKKIIDVLSNRL